MLPVATSALELLAYQIQQIQFCVAQTGKGKEALRLFRRRRKAIIKRWRLAPVYVRSDN